jgi:hypothetical protein
MCAICRDGTSTQGLAEAGIVDVRSSIEASTAVFLTAVAERSSFFLTTDLDQLRLVVIYPPKAHLFALVNSRQDVTRRHLKVAFPTISTFWSVRRGRHDGPGATLWARLAEPQSRSLSLPLSPKSPAAL